MNLKGTQEKEINKISYIYGMVDQLNYGHIRALKKASITADLCVFGVIDDGVSDAYYGTHVSNIHERREVLYAVRYVDEVMDQYSLDPLDNIIELHKKYPKSVITLYHGEERGILHVKQYLESIGGNTIRLEYYKKLAPFNILKVLNNQGNGSGRAREILSTKANTLLSLKGLLTKSEVENIYIAQVWEFRADMHRVLEDIRHQFGDERIVIRSSSIMEDAYEQSNAGHFKSILGCCANDSDSVQKAMYDIIHSYGEKAENEQILIQRQTQNVMISGVVFTRDLRRNRPYYVINYDESGSTDSVTSGETGGKTIWIADKTERKFIPGKWKGLMEAVWEIEELIPDTFLDIEFAVTVSNIVIFQVRPLAAAYKFKRTADTDKIDKQRRLALDVYTLNMDKGLYIYSDMAFWNPAEIIGDNPRNLDYSLYRQIVTRSAWNEGITSLGYHKVPYELMYRFGNKPYINLEYSFMALTPEKLTNELRQKLVTFYIDKLTANKAYHDKIEFEVALTCFDFSLHKNIRFLHNNGFSEEECSELEDSLKKMTFDIIHSYKKMLHNDITDMQQLEMVRLDVQNVLKADDSFGKRSKCIRILFDAIEKFGTPQFSRQARCAFIGKAILQSLINEKLITSVDFNKIMGSIHTIASEYKCDYAAVCDGKMKKESFLRKYGHLRASTYNIRSPRYDESGDIFFLHTDLKASEKRQDKAKEDGGEKGIKMDQIIIAAIDKALEKAEIGKDGGVSSWEILEFARTAIEQRENFKFIFTKSLSMAIELIKQMGEYAGIPTSELSYLEIPEIYAAENYSDISKLKQFWTLIIEARKNIYHDNSSMILPSVICAKEDFFFIENPVSKPNFITEKKIHGRIQIMAEDTDIKNIDMNGKIVCVEKADPGYDWIFSTSFAGLITKYGGAASHMAIRCAEFGIPAAIGCGEKIYEYVCESECVCIDCTEERIFRVE